MVLDFLIAAAILLLFLLYFNKTIQRRMRLVKLVEKMPGPKAYPLIGNAFQYLLTPREKQIENLKQRMDIYKPIYRAWLGTVPYIIITSPEHLEIILNSVKFIDKGDPYKFLHPWLGNGLLTSTGSKWHSRRKMLTPTFHYSILENFVDVFVEKSKILIEKLENHVGNSEFDIYPYISRCTLDIITETAMGTCLNAQEETYSPYVNAISDLREIMRYRFIRPWLYPNFIFSKTNYGKRFNECLKTVHSFTEKIIQERKTLKHVGHDDKIYESHNDENILGLKNKKPFLDLLLDEAVNSELSDLEIREEVDTFMFEGHDTTSAAVAWSLFLLGTHKDIQDKVYHELQNIFHDSDHPAKMHDLQDMKYLGQCIKEALRLFPSVPVIQRQIKEDVQIGQYLVPAGCVAFIPIFYVHLNEEHFPNPQEFNPDNFLPERCHSRHPYAYIPFSAGPRNCIGQKFALLEVKVILSSILRRYEFTSVDTLQNIEKTMELILRPHKGLKMKINYRLK